MTRTKGWSFVRVTILFEFLIVGCICRDLYTNIIIIMIQNVMIDLYIISLILLIIACASETKIFLGWMVVCGYVYAI